MSNIPPLYKHQKESIEFFSNRPRCFDASDAGTGKTRVQIELFAQRRANNGGAALVIALKSLMRSAWADDFARFAPHIVTSVAPAATRAKAFAQESDVYITNVDATSWLAKQPPSFFKKFDTLIIDEVSYFKHRTSKRSKSLNKIKKYFKYRYALTATPNTNSITDIWHPVFLIDDGARLGTSFIQFRSAVCTPQQVGPSPNMLKWVDRDGSDQVVADLLKDITVRHELDDCLDIPVNHMYSVQYHLSRAQQAAYKEMEQHAMTMLESGRIITSANAAGVVTKLLQIASGAVYSEKGTGHSDFDVAVMDKLGFAPIDSDRYALVADLVAERSHSVVFFLWTHQKQMLQEEFKKRGITFATIDGTVSDKNRKQIVDNYQAGFYKVLLAHPMSAAHGLTLTRGVATIWPSPTYNLEHFLQGNRRIYRAGQTKRTETISIIAPNTIESHVFKVLNDKGTRQVSMQALLKDMSQSR